MSVPIELQFKRKLRLHDASLDYVPNLNLVPEKKTLNNTDVLLVEGNVGEENTGEDAQVRRNLTSVSLQHHAKDRQRVSFIQGQELTNQNPPAWPIQLNSSSPCESIRMAQTPTSSESRRAAMRRNLNEHLAEAKRLPMRRSRRENIWETMMRIAWNNDYLKNASNSDKTLENAVGQQAELSITTEVTLGSRKRDHDLIEANHFLTGGCRQSTPVKPTELHFTDFRQLSIVEKSSVSNDSPETETCRHLTSTELDNVNDHKKDKKGFHNIKKAKKCSSKEQNLLLSDARSLQEYQSCIYFKESTTGTDLSGAVMDVESVDGIAHNESALATVKNAIVPYGGGGDEKTDVDKDKYWEEERRVFCERVDSFLARVVPIQGDRHFSRWKGSVLDSVVGVYLTQNTSDYLSSSAFMTLAARFPVTLNDESSKAQAENPSRSTEPLENCIINFDNNKNCAEYMLGQELCDHAENPSRYTEALESCIINFDNTTNCSEDILDEQLCEQGSLLDPNFELVAESEMPVLTQENEHDPEVEIPVPTSKKGSNEKKKGLKKKKVEPRRDWDNLRKQVCPNGGRKERSRDTMDSADWEAVRSADVKLIAQIIEDRGMANMLAQCIKGFLNRMVEDHGSLDLEWLRDVSPKDVQDFLMDIKGLGIKSAECLRLLTLQHVAFPVDVNVARISVRLGWVALEPLPETMMFHELELLPSPENLQQYIWHRICKLDHKKLYELHYHLITFGKVFCSKRSPNCMACPMKGECKYFRSKYAREPLLDIEDAMGDPDATPVIDLIPQDVQNNSEDHDEDLSKALVVRASDTASKARSKAKNARPRRTVHQVYELPDGDPFFELLLELAPREFDDPCPYFLAIWSPGETAESAETPRHFPDSSLGEAEAETLSVTLLVPSRTALRGSFPLNGTYFQVREVFADHESSINPINVPRERLSNLPRRTVYCGTSVSAIFKGLTIGEIEHYFQEGFICLRGFDRKSREPKSLPDKFHLQAKKARKKEKPVAASGEEANMLIADMKTA